MPDYALLPKLNPVRNRPYLDWLRTQPCIITGLYATEYEAVDPAHIGTLGTSIKRSDDETLPIAHSVHLRMHQHGEMTVLRQSLPDDVLRDALRALAREMFKEWEDG